ncbi:unnamed protein product [Bursaphelenchus xylophilus]|uniref:(pine wood nematode) hypothetical protein n=1 Tax=Bursaphelenchus xylophilus TaxID=6326 RepID=A0A1I7RR44_BURXY|nr:unnamed protein product [Bursaphelenchus xylophilus]CAG9130835.1 unnamed protein product [Bursaphelenchus xylophilus]
MEPISDDEARPIIKSYILPDKGKKRNKNELRPEKQRPQHHNLLIFKPGDIPRVGCNKPPRAADDYRSRPELKNAAYRPDLPGMNSPGQKENAPSLPQNSGDSAAQRRPVQSTKSGAKSIRPYINEDQRKLKEADKEKTKKIVALEAKNTSLKTDKATLKDEVGQLRAKIEKKEKKVERLKKELKEKEELAEKNKKIVKEKSSELKKVQAQLKERIEELDKLKAQNEKQEREGKELYNQIEQKDRKIAELELKQEDLEKKLGNAVQQMKYLQFLQEQHPTADSDIMIYQKKLANMVNGKRSLEIDIETLEKANGDLQKKIREGAAFEERLLKELQFCINFCTQLEYQKRVLIGYLKKDYVAKKKAVSTQASTEKKTTAQAPAQVVKIGSPDEPSLFNEVPLSLDQRLQNPTQAAVPKPIEAAGSPRPTVKRPATDDGPSSTFKRPAEIKKIKNEHQDEVIVVKTVKARPTKNVVQVKPAPLSPPPFSSPTPSFVPNAQSRF